MAEQRKITTEGPLLDERGHLVAPGYSTKPVWRYDRRRIAAPWYRIKEWDYYAVLSDKRGYGIAFTLADLGYLGLASVVWLDFERRTFVSLDRMTLLPRGRMGLSETSSSGRVTFEDRKLRMSFEAEPGRRMICATCPGFVDPLGQRGLSAEITLEQDPSADTMVIATSWPENRRAFYYNQKVCCMPATGTIEIGGVVHAFEPDDSFAVLDWGRGNWTYKNRWFWGSASGVIDGKRVGWNIGYGFSDRSVASENMLFLDGRAHKLGEVTFHHDPDDFLKPWRFDSNDGRFEMTLTPLLDRNGATNLLLVKSIQHQVFGRYDGHITLDDGTVLHIEKLLGFAEDVVNWW